MRIAALLSLIVAAPALAQQVDETPAKGVRVTVGGGYLHQFETDFDDRGGGGVSVDRGYGVVGAGFELSPSLDLGLRLAWEGSWYDWDGQSALFLGGTTRPWRDPQSIQLGGNLRMRLDDSWSLQAGLFGTASGELDADVEDTLSIGGILGATYRADERFMIGGGVLVASQIEDDALIIPLIFIDWRINETLRLTNAAGPEAYPTGAGLELVWSATRELDLAIGGKYEVRRFRLDDEGPAPDGVGQDRSFGLWGRAAYRFTPQLRLDFIFGAALGGELRLENDRGNKLAEVDVDPAPFLGLFLSYRF